MQTIQYATIVSYETWMAALASSACIGCTSLVPWLFNMTFFERQKQKQGSQNEDGRMKLLLSFAVGAILGDIFFHLIPESLHSYLEELNVSQEVAHKKVGLSILAGIFMFIIVEMILEKWSHPTATDDKTVDALSPETSKTLQKSDGNCIGEQHIPIFNNKDLKQTLGSLVNSDDLLEKTTENNNNVWTDLNAFNEITEPNNNQAINAIKLSNSNNNNSIKSLDQKLRMRNTQDNVKCNGNYHSNQTEVGAIETIKLKDTSLGDCRVIDTAGYLSLIANGFDNFTHGLAIGASFLVGAKVGLLTTFVIFIHEIPHEICDYAILVNSGFTRWDAVKAQSSVSLFGIVGTATALYVKSVQILTAKTVWILPFSAGGFLYIALVNLLPEILDQKADVRNSLGQAACVILGITFMALVAII